MNKDQYAVRHESDWAGRGTSSSKATRIVSTQGEAKSIAREIARNKHLEMSVQGRNGRFCTCNSYGNDPCLPKDENL